MGSVDSCTAYSLFPVTHAGYALSWSIVNVLMEAIVTDKKYGFQTSRNPYKRKIR